MPWFLGNSSGYNGFYVMPWVIMPMAFWSLIWKGLALWHAAKRNEKWWFIALLIINTVGILEICYLVFVVRLFSSSNAPPKRSSRKR